MKETVGVKGAALEVSPAKELNGLLCPPWKVTEVLILPSDSLEETHVKVNHQ